jgi:hypothetical protein
MSFGESIFLAGLFQKNGKGIKTSNKIALIRGKTNTRRF